MTELEQARTHLREAQELLRCARCDPEGITAGLWKLPSDAARNAERQVLAALSWVWDAQERETYRNLEWLRGQFQKAIESMLLGPPIFNDAEGRQTIGDLIHDFSIKVIDGRTDECQLIEVPFAAGKR